MFLIPTFLFYVDKQHKMGETFLGDYLVFIRRVSCTPAIQRQMANRSWTTLLLKIAGHGSNSFVPLIFNLRIRLLALHLLEVILPSFKSRSDVEFGEEVGV